MKKLGIVLFGISIILPFSLFAYQPSVEDATDLGNLKNQIISLTENDNYTLWSFYEQARDMLPFLKDERLIYFITQIRDYSLSKFNTRKDADKEKSVSLKQAFLDQYQGSGLHTAEELSENCIGRYNTLDNLSYAYNFPTALTIAVWYRETTCGYYLPKNGDGPFQIVSKDYGTGDITKEIFETAIKDFFEFSQHKINWYNSKNPDTQIHLDYTTFSYEDLYKFAGLYNGLSGATVYGDIGPANPKYFLEKMPGEYEAGKKNGLFLQFLKVLERELKQ